LDTLHEITIVYGFPSHKLSEMTSGVTLGFQRFLVAGIVVEPGVYVAAFNREHSDFAFSAAEDRFESAESSSGLLMLPYSKYG